MNQRKTMKEVRREEASNLLGKYVCGNGMVSLM